MSYYYRSHFPSGEMYFMPIKELEAKAKNRAFRTNLILVTLGFVFLLLATFVISPWVDSLLGV